MKTRSRKRNALLTFGVLLIAMSLAWVPVGSKEQRQYALNRQLIAALKRSDTKKALLLIKAGADPNTRLVDQAGADPNSSLDDPESKTTALLMACGACWYDERGSLTSMDSDDRHLTPVVQAMLLHGANANASMKRGWTALMMASTNGYTNIMVLLLQHGAAIDVQDNDGFTALRCAIDTHKREAVKLLLQHHANVNIKDKKALTPLAVALRNARVYTPPNPYTKIIRLLKAAGATK